MERADARLLTVISEAMDEATARAGDRLACRPGCTECCHGPFPVNGLDAARLRRGLEELAARDPGRAAAVSARARGQLPLLASGFPGDAESGLLIDSDEADAYFTRHAGLPCPVLDPETGCCDLEDRGLTRLAGQEAEVFERAPSLEAILAATHQIVDLADLASRPGVEAAVLEQMFAEGVLFREGRHVINLAVRLPRGFAATAESPGIN